MSLWGAHASVPDPPRVLLHPSPLPISSQSSIPACFQGLFIILMESFDNCSETLWSSAFFQQLTVDEVAEMIFWPRAELSVLWEHEFLALGFSSLGSAVLFSAGSEDYFFFFRSKCTQSAPIKFRTPSLASVLYIKGSLGFSFIARQEFPGLIKN